MTCYNITQFSSPADKYPIEYATSSDNSPIEVWKFFSNESPDINNREKGRFFELVSPGSYSGNEEKENVSGSEGEVSLKVDPIEKGKYCAAREITKSSPQSEVKMLNSVLKAWKKVAKDRLAPLRFCYSNESFSEDVRKKAHEDYHKDSAVVRGYADLIQGIEGNINAILRPGTTGYQVRYILDLKNDFWSVCSYLVCPAKDGVPSYLYLDKLVTSGASLPLTSPACFDETESSKLPVIKGGGVLMMHSLYSTAQRLGLSELRLKALDGSVTFYEKIGMTSHNPSQDNEYFSYDVTDNNFPPNLLEYMISKNLMPVDVSSLNV
ncbi:MAG: hypothetical protein FJZ57_08305 [Chlamydiae bacterium]|nr:hypothetical protein [Chlamydiota bacterium]